MAQKLIADYVAKYSNKSSGAGYKSAIEAFLRSVYKVDKKQKPDYESLLVQYLNDGKRNNSQDVKAFADYLKDNSRSKSMQSVRQILTYAVKFLNAQGIVITKEFTGDIKREIKGGAATVATALTSDKICKALNGANVRDRAIILTLASSGLRIGELLSLDMKDIFLNETPVRIVIRAAKAKNKHARFTYCSEEAKEAIQLWLSNRDAFLKESAKHNLALIKTVGDVVKDKHGNDKVITTGKVNTESALLFPVSDAQINASWEACLKRVGLLIKDEESNRNIYRLHSLRKFFDTKLSNTSMPEKLVQYFEGHLSELASKYYVPSEEFASAEYLKYMDVLTCCTSEKTQAEINGLKKTQAQLEKQDATQYESIEYLRSVNKQMLDNMTMLMERMNQLEKVLDLKPDEEITFVGKAKPLQ